METPSVVFYEHSFDDTIIQSLSKNVLNLGNECRALSDENARLKAEVERLTDCKAQADRFKAEVERLLHEVNYWRIEAETDHGRWLRCLEQLEEIRNLK
jgi:hypothetical protein